MRINDEVKKEKKWKFGFKKKINNAKSFDEEIARRLEEASLFSVDSDEYLHATEAIKNMTESKAKLEDSASKKTSLISQIALEGIGISADIGSKRMIMDYETDGGFFDGMMKKSIAKKDIRRKRIRIE